MLKMTLLVAPRFLRRYFLAVLLLCGVLAVAAAGGEEFDINEIPLSVINDVVEESIAEGNLTAAAKGVAIMTEREPDNPYTLNVRGQLALAQGNIDEAVAAWSRLLETASDDVDKAIAHGNLGTIYLDRGDLDSAEASFQASLELNGPDGDRRVMADAYGNLGLICEERGDLTRAEELQGKALELHTKSNNKTGMMKDYINLANIRKRRNEWQQAARLFRSAQEIAESIGNKTRASELQLEIMGLAIPIHEQRMREQRGR